MEYESRALDIIVKKRDSRVLSKDDIAWFVKGIVNGKIPNYLTSAFLMVIYLNGMDINETVHLTESMMDGGHKLRLRLGKPKFDKHSTGGVGDKVSLIVAPLVSSCGIAVPMLSGRSLGHTGGTLNKLESIPGMRINLSREEIEKGVRDIGMTISGQTEEIAPADRKIYALRDKTGTVESIPLIISSILSKKLSEDIDGLVMDIKVGKGAFMKTKERALILGEAIRDVATEMGIKIGVLFTNMNVPLGKSVGTGVEVFEAIKVLKGDEYPHDLMEVSLTLSKSIIDLAGIREIDLLEKIRDGSAYRKFRDFVEYQEGDVSYVDNPDRIFEGYYEEKILAKKSTYVEEMDTQEIGRITVESEDFSQGIIFHKKPGDWVERGEALASIYIMEEMNREFSNKVRLRETTAQLKSAIFSSYRFGKEPVPRERMILEKF